LTCIGASGISGTAGTIAPWRSVGVLAADRVPLWFAVKRDRVVIGKEYRFVMARKA
jgi:hypothetical protein